MTLMAKHKEVGELATPAFKVGDKVRVWSRKGATLSDKSARQEFGLTQQEIVEAILAGKLQFRQSNMRAPTIPAS